jgi:hypothetical protein
MTGLYWKSDWPVAVIHPKLRERELLRNGTRGAIFLGGLTSWLNCPDAREWQANVFNPLFCLYSKTAARR